MVLQLVGDKNEASKQTAASMMAVFHEANPTAVMLDLLAATLLPRFSPNGKDFRNYIGHEDVPAPC